MKLRKEIECIIKSILYPKSQIFLVSDHESNIEKYSDDFKLLSNQHKILQDEISNIENTKITFKNGSSIEIIYPNKPEEVIRGKRAKINPWGWDWEYAAIDNKIFEDVVSPFIIEDTTERDNYEAYFIASSKRD